MIPALFNDNIWQSLVQGHTIALYCAHSIKFYDRKKMVHGAENQCFDSMLVNAYDLTWETVGIVKHYFLFLRI